MSTESLNISVNEMEHSIRRLKAMGEIEGQDEFDTRQIRMSSERAISSSIQEMEDLAAKLKLAIFHNDAMDKNDLETVGQVWKAKHEAELAIRYAHEASRHSLHIRMGELEKLAERLREIQFTLRPALLLQKQQLKIEKEEFLKRLKSQELEDKRREDRRIELMEKEKEYLAEKIRIEDEFISLKQTNDELDEEKYDLQRLIGQEESRVKVKQIEIRDNLIAHFDQQYALKAVEFESKINSLQALNERAKEYDLETAKIQHEIDDELSVLRGTMAACKDKAISLQKQKDELIVKLDDEMNQSTPELNREIAAITAEEEEKLAAEISSQQQHLENDLTRKAIDLKDQITAIAAANEGRVKGLEEYETCIEQYKEYIDKLRTSRHKIFHEFELHVGDWKAFVDANIKALRSQYHQVLMANIDMWSRRGFGDGETGKVLAETLVSDIVHEINVISKATKLAYPTFSTDIPRDIDFSHDEATPFFSREYTALLHGRGHPRTAPNVTMDHFITPLMTSFPGIGGFGFTQLVVSPRKTVHNSTTDVHANIVKLNHVYTSTLPVMQVEAVEEYRYPRRETSPRRDVPAPAPVWAVDTTSTTSTRATTPRTIRRPASAGVTRRKEPNGFSSPVSVSRSRWTTEYSEKFGPNVTSSPTAPSTAKTTPPATRKMNSETAKPSHSQNNPKPAVRQRSARSGLHVSFDNGKGSSQFARKLRAQVSVEGK